MIQIQRHQHGLCGFEVAIGPVALTLHGGQCLDAQCNVVNEADEAWRIRAAHLSDRQERREYAAVAAPGLHLATDADDVGDAGAQVALHVGIVLVAVAPAHQHVDVATERLLLAVAEQAFSRMVEYLNAAGVIDQDDCIDRRVEYGLQFRGRRVGLVHAIGISQ